MNSSLRPWMRREHLAPGDSDSLFGDWADLELHEITRPENPRFESAYDPLWREFGAAGEMETRAAISARMNWENDGVLGGCALRYRLDLVCAHGKFAAVRDHTSIVTEGIPGAIVHLSHNLVAPAWRRSGLAGWMRALPIQTALEHLSACGRDLTEPITLAGEMEPLEHSHTPTATRLRAYTKAGFLMADPHRAPYLQPDFRPPEEIDSSGGPEPLRLNLVLRRVGRENETSISSDEARRIAGALYAMYARGFRDSDMRPVLDALETWASGAISLLPPYSPPGNHREDGH